MRHIIDRDLVRSPVSGSRVSGVERSKGLPPEMLADAARLGESWDRDTATRWWRTHLPELA